MGWAQVLGRGLLGGDEGGMSWDEGGMRGEMRGGMRGGWEWRVG